ncbi:MAG: OmpA family protein [Methylococcaceae bacterium]|nr:OmpA family protein [Methylococcaceae bacterium]
MFDSLITEVASKFGLGSKASSILSALLGLMFNKNTGGMSGFLDKLTSGGLGKIVTSWVGKGDSMAVNATQVEDALGSGVISSMASKLGLASGPVGMAIAHILPKVVNALTPDGVIPDSIPSSIAQYMQNDEHQDTSEVEVKTPNQPSEVIREPEVRTQYQQEDYSQVTDDIDDEASGFRWWWLLLPLFLLLGWCSLKQPATTTTETAVVPEAEPVAPVVPVSKINPSLIIDNETDGFYISGTVADNATKESILAALKSSVGSGKISGDIRVDPATNSAGWLMKLSSILPALKEVVGSKLSFNGNDISLDGSLDQNMIDSLMGKIKDVFGGSSFNISSNAVALPTATDIPDAVTESVDEGKEVLTDTVDEGKEVLTGTVEKGKEVLTDTAEQGNNAIKEMVASGTVTGESLIKALNVAGINFATGSFKITPKSMEMLKNAAEAINAAPDGTHIQVGGHTDNTGSSEINARLSKQRAQAVVDTLVGMGVDGSKLSAEGFGDLQPIADNSTREGRAQNRRMEFTLK